MFKSLAVVVLGAVLVGCATPPGQLKDDEFVWAELTVHQQVQTVFAGLQNNARHCGGLIDQFDPKWYLAQDMHSATIDLYLKGAYGGSSDWVAGIITLSAAQDATIMKVGIQRPYSNPVFRAKEWWKPRVANMAHEIDSGATPSCK